MKRLILISSLLGGLANLLMAQNTPPPPPPETRQFDFWIGHWEVFTPDGKKAGENRIERMAGGWGLLENWTSANAAADGKSLNSWHPVKKQWQQFWVGAGGIIELVGGIKDGAMVMTGEGRKRDGGKLLNRITWTPNPDGTVRQHWEQSGDDGQTWTTAFDGQYRKKPTP